MKIFYKTTITIILLLPTISGYTESTLPKAEDLIARHAEQLYGDTDLDKLSLTLRGTITIEQFNVDGPVVFKYKGRDKFFSNMNIFGTEISRLCNAGKCWSKEMRGSFSALDGKFLAHRQEVGDFGRFNHLSDYYQSLTTVGEEIIEGEPVFKVVGESKHGYSYDFYFAKATGLLVSTHSKIPFTESVSENTTFLSNFQQHGPLRLATQWYESNPQIDSLIKITEVSFDPIPDSDFASPIVE